jgi:glucose-1-phosphate cytidylyltransferase
MNVVILAGGLGSRLAEETNKIPKPMIKIGNKPILWHIMKFYSAYNLNNFVICGGYKYKIIINFFRKFCSSKIVHIKKKKHIQFFCKKENWKVIVVNTGAKTMTGGRIKRIKDFLDKKDKNFCLTYGDGLTNVNLKKLISYHDCESNALATVLAVRPPARFGSLKIIKNKVIRFSEKNSSDEGWINGGFFVLSKKIFKFIKNDKTFWERYPLEKLSKLRKLNAFKHKKFWMAMDTIRDKNNINKIWSSGKAPWKIWKK